MKALVIGASGLVGAALLRVLQANGVDAVGTARTRVVPGLRALDMTRAEEVDALLGVPYDVVFLPAALTNVDYCEDHPDEAHAVNVTPIRSIASATARSGALLVYYSTDYVFDGTAGPYAEDAQPSPINVYGRTKAEAEQIVRLSGCRHLILRTTVVFGWDPSSKNSVMQLWRRLRSGERMTVPSDQMGNPTLADYLAEVSLRLVQSGVEGVVNVVGQDWVSRIDFARRAAEVFGLDQTLLTPAATRDLRQRARRPLSGGLMTDKLSQLLGTEPMPLDEALKRLRRQWRVDTHEREHPRSLSSEAEKLRHDILDRVTEYYELVHRPAAFVPHRSRVNYAGRVFGPEELRNATEAVLDFWLTLGPWGDLVERRLAEHFGARDVVLVNSGSSANLTAVATLASPLVEHPLKPGDEVITPAVTFPTTLAPLIQHGLVPVFVDAEIGTYNVNPGLLDAAISPRTRALMLPHSLGNPFDLDVVCDLTQRYGLYLIEDACDALGSQWGGRPVGTFGDLATLSFYPAHHITMGEGGAVVVNRARHSRVVRSIRDWGRDCWCAPGESNTCGKRFGWCVGDLPMGYDHKYTYSQLGYNLKPTDLQAAIGAAQLDRLPHFVAARRRNFSRLYAGLQAYSDHLILPSWPEKANPAWFGLPITVANGLSRRALIGWLEDSKIETREVFGGNILRQPGYRSIPHRVAGTLEVSDRIMRDTFFIGVYPGLTDEMIEYILDRFRTFFAQRRGRV